MDSNLINNKYKLLNKIGSGAFGSIYRAQNIRTKEYVAIKVEQIQSQFKMLKNETNIYQYLSGSPGIPQVKWYGKDSSNYYMVLNLLGDSLQTLINAAKIFSLDIILKIGIKIIEILRIVHEKGLIHRDIKPENFLFDSNHKNQIYLIDFGFCKSYINKETGEHNPIKPISGLIGSMNYASIRSHERLELSRRDDLESVCYILMYFYSGYLPWFSERNEESVLNKKLNIIQSKEYPEVLLDLLKYVRCMEYNEKPNYSLIISDLENKI